jgi:hypothetical protein
MKRSLCADGEMAHGPKRVKPELGITVKLEEYQEVALDKVMKNRVTYVCWPPGCGKTVLALCAAIQWGQGPVIVVAPLSLHDNFRRSMKQFQVPRNQQDRFLFYTAAGFKKQFVRDRQFTKGHMIIVDEAHQFRTDIRKGIMDTLARKKKEMSWMVVHQIRNHIHNRVIQHIPQEPEYECVVTQSLAMLEACRMADKILFMSGTPCVNKVSDLANFYAIAKGLDVPNHDDFNEIIWDQVSEVRIEKQRLQ